MPHRNILMGRGLVILTVWSIFAWSVLPISIDLDSTYICIPTHMVLCISIRRSLLPDIHSTEQCCLVLFTALTGGLASNCSLMETLIYLIKTLKTGIMTSPSQSQEVCHAEHCSSQQTFYNKQADISLSLQGPICTFVVKQNKKNLLRDLSCIICIRTSIIPIKYLSLLLVFKKLKTSSEYYSVIK